ncbi:hypothetical protein SAMN04515679_1766 [Pelosinus fermentans]|uniref:Uncharacterized protein n=1 Tax=Pelosinus fermentans B4 TaxID=1149862 RepID=I8RNR3_9FIRM|nr:hypothetical protein FB4_1962 [Pelosinus fermentans B4]EIW25405.1 hypothetical protein FA11_2564 [Pelosinus fermentans A11]OAM91982.1 hypothetical protein FR7_04637 [Pelosinus fermentans DSM 17108]SDQ03062.1 hypothetical protein SAMN04515679_0023 [Pelosinus fermentans]OAM93663.1 hypothetical protein FR7_01680 [Pelosinus fermentans DSM 17108]
MAGRYKTIISLLYCRKVVHNLSRNNDTESRKLVKKYAQKMNKLSAKIKSKGWVIAG